MKNKNFNFQIRKFKNPEKSVLDMKIILLFYTVGFVLSTKWNKWAKSWNKKVPKPGISGRAHSQRTNQKRKGSDDELLKNIPEEVRPILYLTGEEFEKPDFREPPYQLTCYQCENEKSEGACDKNIVTCAPNALSCETHIRVWNDGRDVSVSKQCKQPLACFNNFIQNPRDAFPWSQCQNLGTFNKDANLKDANGTFPNWVNPNPLYLVNSGWLLDFLLVLYFILVGIFVLAVGMILKTIQSMSLLL